MTVEDRISPETVNGILEAIYEASGNEVLIVGTVDRDKKVTGITIAARGHAEAVSALNPFMEKGDVVIHNHPSGRLTPSSADIQIASRLGNQGIGFYIINNQVDRGYVVAEPVEVREITPLNTAALAGFLKNGGRLSGCFPDYEERTSQVAMLEFICEGFNRKSIRIAEAGTGVGKSLAYLIPAVDWILKNDERVVVSTSTINLQQQLIEQDIPLVKKMFSSDPGVCLVKGRGNYICLTRLQEALEEITLFEEEKSEIKAIGSWAGDSKTGSRSDLSFYPSEEVWSRVCSEADACYGLRCPNREKCFVIKSRREAASARLLVVNHHLLFSDLSLRLSGTGFESSAVLPPFQHIIFDEAHNVEKSATSFFSTHFSRASIGKYVGRLFRRKKNRRSGLLLGLEKLAGPGKKIAAFRDALDLILDKADILNAVSLSLMAGQASLRLNPSGFEAEFSDEFFTDLKELKDAIAVSVNSFEGLLTQLSEEEQESIVVFESKVQLRRLLKAAEGCESFLKFKEDRQNIYWLDTKTSFRGERYVRFVITPLVISPVMRKAVYEPYGTIIFTSATLTVGDCFDYWKIRLGFNHGVEREISENVFPSPFNYPDNVLLGIPQEAPFPDQDGYEGFVADFVKEVLLISEGRALVLFTSYALLRETFNGIQGELTEKGIPVMRQGDEDRNRLMNRFRADTSSVLFATDSFWEGVDAPGESLEVVILSRLPFRVPTDPILQARMDEIRERGGNPFMELSLPDAVIRLRQGFGRLIRRASDKGIVLILDSRIVNKRYGAYFLSSLPETRRIISSTAGVIDSVEDFIVQIRKDLRPSRLKPR